MRATTSFGRRWLWALAPLGMAAAGCSGNGTPAPNAGSTSPAPTPAPTPSASVNAGGLAATPLAAAPFTLQEAGDFDVPWAIAFLPGGDALVTERSGALKLWREGQPTRTIAGTPSVSFAGQGGLGDVVLHPDFASNRLVYLSWAEAGTGGKGAVVGRARLSDDMARLESLTVIWRQSPKVEGDGHFGHRIAFGPDGMLYISSGERQKFTPAQDRDQNLGKIIRLTDSGAIPADNPWAAEGGVRAQIWSLGHRNPLGIAFDSAGRLWETEMGPEGGDELNLIQRGGNYGYPNASNGSRYGGADIPDHAPGDGYVAPLIWWTPVISPGGLLIYSGSRFPAWRGDAFIPALSGQGLVRVHLSGASATPGDRWATGFRVRAVAQSPDGGLWLLEDGGTAGQGRLFRMIPKS